MSPTPLRVEEGSLLAYRIFDVGDVIRLDDVERRDPELARRRALFECTAPDALALTSPPIEIDLGRRTVALESTTLVAEAKARVFAYGAISILYEVALERGTELAALAPLCDEIYDSPKLEATALAEVERLAEKLASAIERPHHWRVAETYTVVFLRRVEGAGVARDLLAWPGLPKLLLGESSPRALSHQEEVDVLRHAHSYFDDDLAVLDWNSAIVLEPSGSRAIPDLLELATSQLLELRYYDGLFDAELARIYDHLEIARHRSVALLRNPYARLARDVLSRLVELTEFTERVDNTLKVVGDIYLARVYQSAIDRFRLATWRRSIDQKQALVAQAYALVKGELATRRSTFLEIVIMVLILLEVGMALRKP